MEQESCVEKRLNAIEESEGASITQDPTDRISTAETRMRKKLDRHLIPLVFVLLMLAFLDQSNIGNARIAGMAKDVELVGDRYEWLINVFFIAHISFAWTILFWILYPPHVMMAVGAFSWGLISTLQATAHTWKGLMILRFFLGIFEAVYGPGVIYFLSFFYLKHEIGLRCGILVSSAPLASTFSGALAYGVTSGHSRLANWRLLFLVQGLPALLMAPITCFFLPSSPDKAKFLTVEEKAIAKSRAVRQAGTSERVGIKSLNLREVAVAFSSLTAWIPSLICFSASVSAASLPFFLPTILKDMGYSGIDAQGLSAAPMFAAFFAVIIMAWVADKAQQRGLALTVSSVVAGIGYVILATVDILSAKYFATFLATAGAFSTTPNILAWTLNNQGSDTRRGAGLVLINLIGECGPFLGTRLFPEKQAPRYVKGMSICAAFMFFSAMLAVILRTWLVLENRRLDQRYGKLNELGTDVEEIAVENQNNSKFRYVL